MPMKPYKPRLIQLPLVGKIFLCVLAGVYVLYLVTFGKTLFPSLFTPSTSIAEHEITTSPSVSIQHWTAENMRSAINADEQVDTSSDLTQTSTDTSQATA